MSENNQSGNRWEAKAAEADEPAESLAGDPSGVPAASDAESPADAQVQVPPSVPPAVPVEPGSSRRPAWLSRRALAASAAAGAIFLGGGGVGYAIGAHDGGGDDRRPFPGRVDVDGDRFGPGQQSGGGQGNFPGPPQQGQFQGQSDDGSSSGSDSGTAS